MLYGLDSAQYMNPVFVSFLKVHNLFPWSIGVQTINAIGSKYLDHDIPRNPKP